MKENKKITGGCFCGAITYSFSPPTKGIINCHCSMCRRLSGADYTTWVCVLKSDFSFEHGEENLKSFSVTDEITKIFCADCGTPIVTIDNNYPDIYAIHRGMLKDKLDEVTAAHMYYGSKASWFETYDELPKYSEDSESELI